MRHVNGMRIGNLIRSLFAISDGDREIERQRSLMN